MPSGSYRSCLVTLFGAVALAGCAAGTPGTGGGPCVADRDCSDDGVFCNGHPVCEAGVCVDGVAPTCDDGVGCTVDSCSPMSDECQHVADSSRCPEATVCEVGGGCVAPTSCEFDDDCGGDGVFCNGDEVCFEAMCVSPAMRSCDDGDSCTIDLCVEADDTCQ